MQQAKTVLLAQFSETFNQLFCRLLNWSRFWQMTGVQLIFPCGIHWKKAASTARLVYRRLNLEHLRLAGAAPRQIEARIERRLMRLP